MVKRIPIGSGFVGRSDLEMKVNGVQEKYYNPVTRQYVKLDSPNGHSDAASEGLREDLIYHVIREFDFEHTVKYESILFEKEDGWAKGVLTDNFKKITEVEIRFNQKHLVEDRSSSSDAATFGDYVADEEIISKEILVLNGEDGGRQFYRDFLRMLSFDAIINNDDRYLNNGNFGLLQDKISKQKRLIPPFDHGNAIEEEYDEQQIKNKIDMMAQMLRIYSIPKPLLHANTRSVLRILNEYQNELYDEHVINIFTEYLKFALSYSRGKLWTEVEHNENN